MSGYIGQKIDTGINLFNKIVSPFGRLRILPTCINYFKYLSDLTRYTKQSNEKIKMADLTPMLFERTTSQSFDSHYFYQGVWAFEKINSISPKCHVDIGGQIDLIGYLTTIVSVEYVDIRRLEFSLPNFKSIMGNVLSLPYKNESVHSLTCLHVAEHIGLGRYGDSLDSQGSLKAIEEIKRVLAPNANLFFSVPIGEDKVCFNAHRIHSLQKIIKYFHGLELKELSLVNDKGEYIRNIAPQDVQPVNYGLGLFHFKK